MTKPDEQFSFQEKTTSKTVFHSIEEYRRSCYPNADACKRILHDLRGVFLGLAHRHDPVVCEADIYRDDFREYVQHEKKENVINRDGWNSFAYGFLSEPRISDDREEAQRNDWRAIEKPDSSTSLYRKPAILFELRTKYNYEARAFDAFQKCASDAGYALLGLFDMHCQQFRIPELISKDYFSDFTLRDSSTGLPSDLCRRWTIFLHLAGWQQAQNSPLRAGRSYRWSNSSLSFYDVNELTSKLDNQKLKDKLNLQFPLRAFSSALYQDLNLASVYAIDMILGENFKAESFSPTELKKRLIDISPGRNDAEAYKLLAVDVLKYIFAGFLSDITPEQPVDEGRGRVDIMADNLAEAGFFNELRMRYHIHCPYIPIECKNYSDDIGAPEFAQIHSRLSRSRGNFGLVICRSIKDQSRCFAYCRDKWVQESKAVVILSDENLVEMIDARMQRDMEAIWALFREKMKVIHLDPK